MYARGTSEEPSTSFGVYDKEAWEMHCKWDASRFPGCDFGDVGDEMLISDDVMFDLGAALRSAWRLGKFHVAILMIQDLVRSMENDLKLSSVMKEERRHQAPTELFEADRRDELPLINSIFFLLPMLSPLAIYKWSKAYEAGGKKQESFLEEIEDIQKMILCSFTLKEA
jgi:hypothetical protein